jgi:branched-chain amino acid transport system substrate-binding protein
MPVINVVTEEVAMSMSSFRQESMAGWRVPSSAKRGVVAALILIAPLFTTLLGPSARAQDASGPLRIAVLFPFTGDLSDFGEPFLQAAELAVNEINAGGGVHGQPIELV